MKPLKLPTREDILAAFEQGPNGVIALFEAQNAVIEQLLARLQVLEDHLKFGNFHLVAEQLHLLLCKIALGYLMFINTSVISL
jgi:hypothetical protein